MTTRKVPRLLPTPSWTGRSIEEHARGIEAACATAIQLLESAPDREARLRYIDPVPKSTLMIIRRLIAAANG